jgi:tRNA(Ile)-lysidine synthase
VKRSNGESKPKSMVFEKFNRAVKTHCMVQCGDKVIVAVSGGADSIALLHLFLQIRKQYQLELIVGHFNHKLRGEESDADEEFVKRMACHYNLTCITDHVFSSQGCPVLEQYSEARSRQKRYEFLTRLAETQSAQKVALGHTMNDQAETVLMRLIRGSGTLGLAAIPVTREKLFIRPMLHISRKEILTCLRDNQLPWRQDSSNAGDKFLRNQIRHQLIPVLENHYNPHIVELLSQTATHLREDAEALSELTSEVFMREALVSEDTITWNAEKLASFPAGVTKNLIRYSFFKFRKNSEFVSARNVEAIRELLCAGKSGKFLTIGGVRVSRDFQSLIFKRAKPAHGERLNYSCHLSIPGEVEIVEVGSIFKAVLEKSSGEENLLDRWEFYVSPEELNSGLWIRNWKSGDTYFPSGASSEKKIKELFLLRRIVRSLRGVWPVITLNDKIIFAKGFPVSADRISEVSSLRNKKIVVEERKSVRKAG